MKRNWRLLDEKYLPILRDLRAFFDSRAVVWTRVIALRAALRVLPGVTNLSTFCFLGADHFIKNIARHNLIFAAIRVAFVARARMIYPDAVEQKAHQRAAQHFHAQYIAAINATEAFCSQNPLPFGGDYMYGSIVTGQETGLLSLRWLANSLDTRPFTNTDNSYLYINLEQKFDFATLSRFGPTWYEDLSVWSGVLLQNMLSDIVKISNRLNEGTHDNIAKTLLDAPLFQDETDRLFAQRHQRDFFENPGDVKRIEALALPRSTLRWLFAQHIGAPGSAEDPERMPQRAAHIANLPDSFWNYCRPAFFDDLDACFEGDFG